MEAILHIETGERAGETASVGAGETKVVGSGPDANVRLSDAGVHAAHAAIMLRGDGLKVVDLVGATQLNGQAMPLRRPVPARTDDELTVGGVALRVEVLGDDATQVDGRIPPSPLRSPLPLGEFQVARELGRGAMGIVYQAVRLADRQPVAVKVLMERVVEGSEAHRRFVTEGQVGQRIQSPYVVRVLDLQVRGDTAFIIMEWVQGPSAKQFLRSGQCGPEDALRICEHVALALAAAGQVGVIHRDVKPENVLLDPSGVAKLTDFGIAKDLDTTMRSLTQSGVGLGTLAYMAPEAASGAKHVDTSADLYSLGATLYTLLAGKPPFDVRKPEELIKVLREPAPSLAEHVPHCPADLTQLCAQLLAKDPYARPPRADVVAHQLATIRQREFG